MGPVPYTIRKLFTPDNNNKGKTRSTQTNDASFMGKVS